MKDDEPCGHKADRIVETVTRDFGRYVVEICSKCRLIVCTKMTRGEQRKLKGEMSNSG